MASPSVLAVLSSTVREPTRSSNTGYVFPSSRNYGIVKLGSELTSLKGISVQAGGDLFWGSAEAYGGCGAPGLYSPIPGPVRPMLVL